MIIFIRHSDDEDSDPTYKLDPNLTPHGIKLAQSKGRKIIEKYGVPSIIYTSPFRRTKQTVNYMLSSLSNSQKQEIKISHVSKLSRYFTRSEKRRPKIDKSTMKNNIPIYETHDDFVKRTVKIAKIISKFINTPEIIWCVTHTVIYKRVAKYYDITLPNYIPFMDYFEIKHLKDLRSSKSSKSSKSTYCQACQKYH